MKHVVLLGDSVFDNKAYVDGGPDVSEQLRGLVSEDWKVTLHAQDGAVISGVIRQLENIPQDATHLVISAGGNDALGESGVLDAPARSVAEALQRLGEIQDRFRQNYVHMLSAVAVRNIPAAVCTIYDPRYPDALRRRLSGIALSIVNDSITREAFRRGLDVLDLRVMFDQDADFANPIEPSVQGGMKLARGIHRFAAGSAGRSSVIV